MAYRLHGFRTNVHMSKAELARRSGVSEQSISDYESGAAVPSLENACAICAALGRSPDDLCGLTDAARALDSIRLAGVV